MANGEDPETSNHSSQEEDPTARNSDAVEEHAVGSASRSCQHYRRRCLLVCPDCPDGFDVHWCRHCHDADNEKETDPNKFHRLDRSRVSSIVCGECGERQPVSAFCSNAQCGTTFGEYTCTKCPFFDDRSERKYFHCDECGICRVGGRDNFFHCPTCDGWYAWHLVPPPPSRLPCLSLAPRARSPALRRVWRITTRAWSRT